jgi:hypothetical protein
VVLVTVFYELIEDLQNMLLFLIIP